MRHRHGLWVSAAVAFAFAAPLLDAGCLPALQTISAVGVFPNRLAGPIATNGSIIGMAKVDSDPLTAAIFFSTYSGDLHQLTADTLVAARSLKGPVALFWTGSEFGLFYQAPTLVLMLQRIDASGNLIGGPIAIASHGWSAADEFDVGWVPARSAYAIARTVTIGTDVGLWLIVIDRSGAVAFDGNLTVLMSPPTLPHVAALSDGTIEVVWARSGDAPIVLVSSVSPSGALSAVAVVQRAVTDLRIATNGNSTLVIEQVPVTGGTQLRYAQVASGKVTTPDSLFLNGSGVDVAPRWLSWNPALSEWVLLYVDAPAGLTVLPGDNRLRRFSSPAGLASDTLVAQSVVYSHLPTLSPSLFLDNSYITPIARRLSSAEGSESYLVKSCPFIVTAIADHPIWKPFVPIKFTALPSGGIAGFTYSWDFGDLSSGTGEVVQHAYNLEGTYNVTLSATDAAGAQSVYKFTVQVVNQRRRAVK